MEWQDIVLSVGIWIFLIALIPSMRSSNKPALGTSLLTASVLTVFAVTYASLGLWNAFGSAVALVLGWLFLAYQVYAKKRHISAGTK